MFGNFLQRIAPIIANINKHKLIFPASKRDGGVLSEQDIATWVDELVIVIIIIDLMVIVGNYHCHD